MSTKSTFEIATNIDYKLEELKDTEKMEKFQLVCKDFESKIALLVDRDSRIQNYQNEFNFITIL